MIEIVIAAICCLTLLILAGGAAFVYFKSNQKPTSAFDADVLTRLGKLEQSIAKLTMKVNRTTLGKALGGE